MIVQSAWLQERAQLAAYAHIPVGNMGDDWMISAADALYGRCLRDAKHLLWAQDVNLPSICQATSLAEPSLAAPDLAPMDVSFVQLRLSTLPANSK